MQLTGILRELAFSPFQHAENDRRILELTAESLVRKGHEVRILSEHEVGRTPITSPVIFSMCQGPEATAALADLERRGRLIINSPLGVQSCYRVNLFHAAGPGCPILAPTALITTEPDRFAPPSFAGGQAYWVKRGDVHATQAGDVVKVTTPGEFVNVVADMRGRGISEAAVQAHIDGVVVKFYGVVGAPFFRWYAERDYKVCPVIFGSKRPPIEALVRRLGLEVYGGDAVIAEDGRVFVIDINDWPSFAYYRTEAAEVIAAHIHARAAALARAASHVAVPMQRSSRR